MLSIEQTITLRKNAITSFYLPVLNFLVSDKRFSEKTRNFRTRLQCTGGTLCCRITPSLVNHVSKCAIAPNSNYICRMASSEGANSEIYPSRKLRYELPRKEEMTASERERRRISRFNRKLKEAMMLMEAQDRERRARRRNEQDLADRRNGIGYEEFCREMTRALEEDEAAQNIEMSNESKNKKKPHKGESVKIVE